MNSARLLSIGLLAYLSCISCKKQSALAWAESSAPAARVNQHGYLKQGPKRAIVKSAATSPQQVELIDDGGVLWRGHSTPFGLDAASGDPVHHVDFSEFSGTGRNLRLRVLGEESLPFAVGDDLYARLAIDALKYFYHNRSGVPIVRPYVPSNDWARQPGHLSDASVPCVPASDCGRIDVSGGWYDAGDHGKYVVNGGISTWTLLALFLRDARFARKPGAFADDSLNIPESGNQVPDLLDEARFELEFLLKMQVPPGSIDAGLVHHKIHDGAWTPLPFEPPSETNGRAVHAPSTAATLNLAAVTAQAARIFKRYDPAFSQRCLAAARAALTAAEKHPARLAPEQDNQGGGPYSDRVLTDEFYWARVELWLAEPRDELWDQIEQSPHHQQFPSRLEHEDGSFDGDGVTASMTWQSTAALGWLSLVLTPDALPPAERLRLEQGVVSAADFYLSVAHEEGYLLPLGLGASRKYPWGSNSFVLNNMVVLSLAADLTRDSKYAAGVVYGMDYLLGKNPLLQSYISGYGHVAFQNPHHRFWAHSKDKRYPPPPPGAVSGGPNSSLQDPQTKKSGLSKELPPQKCYVDHIEAWSVNEVAINWNAPLAWTAAFLDDWRGSPQMPK